MTGFLGVSTRMLLRRGVAATDVAALGTAPEVEPPSAGGEALDAAIAAGGDARVDR
jgi:hypothetical protein